MSLLKAKKATIYQKKHRSGNTTWCVNVGMKHGGVSDVRNFPNREQAVNFQGEWNSRLVEKNSVGLSDLTHLSRLEILAAIAKLQAFDATLPEAVDFFIKFSRPPKGNITPEEALGVFLEKKAKAGRSLAYLRNCEKTFYKPFAKFFSNRKVADIIPQEAERYIYSHKTWNSVTTSSHITYLTTFYRFLIKQGYAKLNPFEHVERPRRVEASAKILLPEQAKKLLQFALDNNNKAGCASMVLVLFCGVRVEEVSRLNWADIDFVKGKIDLKASATKKGRRRVNTIPRNALEWLELCRASGDIAPSDYLQKMKRLRKKVGLKYPQNAMRQSFSAYHVAKHGDKNLTASLLGHPNANLLFRTYNDLITNEEQVAAYWDVVPDSTLAARQRALVLKMEESREEAICQSNCGRAIQIESGWAPVQDESLF
jgi:integrase